ncbi:hypothetical protein TNIN_135221 [Trichonephila inaurata madagascariensis]|uniref:Endonuclease/exonuclease/phosphatase domain-containing protein n=1 Tax=Trichonephila inaurata madagascariensis TaxID=2747483 RepID=A0A8X6YSQ7_9ARAC|nr:hypothetical protein TNIN_135221 [Trichonephila inaurata madagascariensis]
MDKNTIVQGKLNAKHTIWRSSCNKDKEDILQMMDDKEFIILNDGEPILTRPLATTLLRHLIFLLPMQIFSLNAPGPYWIHIGSDHFPIHVEFSKRQRVVINQDKFRNLKVANWDSFREVVDTCLTSEPMDDNLTHSWTVLKK